MRTVCTCFAGVLALTVGLMVGGRNTLNAQEGATNKSPAGKSGYHLIKKVKLGGEGKVVGDIPNTPGVHGIALVPEMNKGFTSNGKTATSTIFDMKTLEKLGEASTEKD